MFAQGLKKGGTRGEGRLSRDHGNGNLAPVPFTESRRLWYPPLILLLCTVHLKT